MKAGAFLAGMGAFLLVFLLIAVLFFGSAWLVGAWIGIVEKWAGWASR